MKGILVLISGLGDRNCRLLDDSTPLELAKTPNLDYLAKMGRLGCLFPLGESVPETSSAILSLFGNNPKIVSRGVLEALGAGISFNRGDLALRVNFASIDKLEQGKIFARRAGRTLTTKEAKILANEINKIFLPREFIFKPTIQHRGILVLRGGFSDNITNTDPAYRFLDKQTEDFKFSIALDDDENSEYTANVINELIEQTFIKLNNHSINQERRKKGLLPANIFLTRDAGIEIPKLKQYKDWMAVQYMPLEMGFCKTSGMKVFSFKYPDMKKNDVYKNLHDGLEKAIKFSIKQLKKNKKHYNYAFVSFKETDIPGHDNKPLEKKEMIEILDKKFFSFLRKFAEKSKIKIVIAGDHSTPCELKEHSSDSLPLLVFEPGGGKDKTVVFNESQAKIGDLGDVSGKDFLKAVGFI